MSQIRVAASDSQAIVTEQPAFGTSVTLAMFTQPILKRKVQLENTIMCIETNIFQT